MRNLFLLGLAAMALAAFGCSSNSVGDLTGPSSSAPELSAAAIPGGTPTPTITIPAGALAFYGTVSGFSSGGFVLTNPDGRSVNVTTGENTRVLFQGDLSDAGSSSLRNGQQISLWGRVEGRPAGPPNGQTIQALLIVINGRKANLD